MAMGALVGGGDRVLVGVGVDNGGEVGVAVGSGVGAGVAVGSGVAVGVAVGSGLGVRVAVGMGAASSVSPWPDSDQRLAPSALIARTWTS